MTRLSGVLARWRKQLELFPEEVASVLGALVQRLAPAFDALVAAHETPSGDVDGFDGITHRGSYERLLSTEWMLRQAAPLEFLRRAVSGEHAFLRIARREPAVHEGTLVLLDAGPDQLGDCRLAQLALLVLHVERAEARGHDLVWQLLHVQGEGLRSGLNEQTVRSFLVGRTGSRSGKETLEGWAEAAKRRRLWLIGSPAVIALGSSAFARISLRERVAPGSRALELKLVSGARAREVVLTLPDPTVAARLIRDPFQQATAPKTKHGGVASHLLLSAKGSRLFYRDKHQQLVSLSVPNSPRATAGSPRHFQVKPGATVSSVGGRGRKLVWLCHSQGEVSVHFADQRQYPKTGALVAEGPLPARDELSFLAWFHGEQMAVYCAHDRSLWRTDFRTRRSVCIAEGVRSWVRLREQHLVVVDRSLTSPVSPGVLELKPYNETRLISFHASWRDAKLVAVDPSGSSVTLGVEQDGVWHLSEHLLQKGTWVASNRTSSLHTPPNAIVLGIEGYTSQKHRPGLWLLEPDRRTITIVRIRSSQTVIVAPETIAHACLACSAPVLALTTVDGTLLVVDDEGQVRFRGTENA